MIRRILIIVLVGLVGAAAAGDQVARVYAEHQIEQRAAAYFDQSTDKPTGSSAHISSFPFTGRLLISGEIRHVDVSVFGATLEQLLLRRLTLRLSGVKLDRGQLFKGKVRLVDLQRGAVEVDVDGKSLAQRIGSDVRFHPGTVEVHGRIAGQDVVATGSLTVSGNVLTFRPTGVQGVALPGAAAALAFTYRLPKSDLFPCAATVTPVEGALRVGCTIDHIPPGLAGTLSN